MAKYKTGDVLIAHNGFADYILTIELAGPTTYKTSWHYKHNFKATARSWECMYEEIDTYKYRFATKLEKALK